MKRRTILVLVGTAAVAVAACSSSSTYGINGLCGPLTIGSSGTLITVAGPCALGGAGNFTLAAALDVTLGATGAVPVVADAGFVQGGNILFSRFSGTANVPTNPLTTPVTIGGTFTFQGGTGGYSDATGSATADGGVNLGAGEANLLLNGSVTY